MRKKHMNCNAVALTKVLLPHVIDPHQNCLQPEISKPNAKHWKTEGLNFLSVPEFYNSKNQNPLFRRKCPLKVLHLKSQSACFGTGDSHLKPGKDNTGTMTRAA